MKTIVVLNSKGGVGKSTITRHLAVAAEQDHEPLSEWVSRKLAPDSGRKKTRQVAMCDSDPQGSLSDWWNARLWGTPTLVNIGLSQFEHHFKSLSQQFDYLFIDTASASSREYANLLPMADLLLIPVIPGADDLRSLNKLTIPVAIDSGRPICFVMNNTRMGGSYVAATASELERQGKLCPTIIQRRVAHFKAALSGSTVLEDAPKSKGAQEIRDVWSFVKEQLDEIGEREREIAHAG